jgi:hypothetical protein
MADTVIDIPSVTNLLPNTPTLPQTVAAFSVFRLSIPVIQNLASRVGAVALTGGVAIAIAINPKGSFEVVQSVFQTTTDYINLFFNVVSDYIRSETKQAVEYAERRDQGQRALPPPEHAEHADEAPPPPPKLYTIENFPYYAKGSPPDLTPNFHDTNEVIMAYWRLHVDVIRMVLNDHQLPDPYLMKRIYYELIKQTHPDRGGTNQEAIQLNLAYEIVKQVIKDPETQIETLRRITIHYTQDRGRTTPTLTSPYISLFLFGSFFSFYLVRTVNNRKRKN